VQLTTERTARLDPGSTLQTDRGPLTVVTASPHQDRWIVRFDGFTDRAEVESWRGVVLRAEPTDADDDEDVLWVHELIGATVVEADGTPRGTCVAVVENPAADLLELDSGALVPVVFVTEHAPGRIVIDPPPGLFELSE
jgi:16S rRNA processing protein RimM